MKQLGIYIHIPFCIKKCEYCDFISYYDKNIYIEKYIKALKKEIKNTLEPLVIKNLSLKNSQYKITTIYIGGGTPSSIPSKYILEIMNTINKINNIKNNSIEVTIEMNPGTVTKQELIDYKKAGINRLSIGLQETDNKLLKSIGRIHTYEQFIDIYKLAREIRI